MTVASFIASQRTEHGASHALSCRALDVPESTFYKWRDRPPTPRQARRVELDAAVKASFDESGGTPGTYGSPRVFEDLVEAGWRVSKKSVAASMVRQGLAGRCPKRKRRWLTRPDKAAAPIPDLVKRDFAAGVINQRWCGDLTEIPTDEGKLYLATVLDLASRRLPGFAIGEHHDAPLAKAALDNAAAESFNSTLEWELLSRRQFATKDQARRDVAAFIDAYNHQRRHSTCEMLPPVAYEQMLAERDAERARHDRAA